MAQPRYVSADHINDLFYKAPRKKLMPSWQLLSASLLIVLGIFFLVNAPAVSQQLSYWWESDIVSGKQTQEQLKNKPANSQIQVPNPAGVSSSAPATATTTKTNTQTAQQLEAQLAALPNNTLYIPKIRTKAPIIWDVSGGADLNTDLLNALRRGIARYPQTALPNQSGNVFLTGHSSDYWWEKGNYKTIFALLNRLVAGDMVYIKYQNTLYAYRVNGQKIVKPSETSVLAPTKTPTLSLMTCTPTGTALLRRIVTADLVSPVGDLTAQPTQPDLNRASLETVR